MRQEEIRVSSEVDAFCTKCRMVTNHRVVAMMEDTIKRVICLTCDGQHNFRPPPGQKTSKTTKPKRVQKDMKKSRASAPKTYEKWLDLKNKLAADPRPYRMDQVFEAGEAIDHVKFGLGFVVKVVVPNKIDVMFEQEIKTLAMNR